MRWRINLQNRTACLLPECKLKADVTVATPDAVAFTIHGAPNIESRFYVDRSTSTFIWTVEPPGRKYGGRCSEARGSGD